MPAFQWLFEDTIDAKTTPVKLATLRKLGVPYTDADIAGAEAAVKDVREIDALIAYLQQLGTLIQARR